MIVFAVLNLLYVDFKGKKHCITVIKMKLFCIKVIHGNNKCYKHNVTK